jgi:hypothetical protein
MSRQASQMSQEAPPAKRNHIDDHDDDVVVVGETAAAATAATDTGATNTCATTTTIRGCTTTDATTSAAAAGTDAAPGGGGGGGGGGASPGGDLPNLLPNLNAGTRGLRPYVDCADVLEITPVFKKEKAAKRKFYNEEYQQVAYFRVVVRDPTSGETYEALLRLPAVDSILSIEAFQTGKPLPADLEKYALAGSTKHKMGLDQYLGEVRAVVSRLDGPLIASECSGLPTLVLILLCFDKLATFKLLQEMTSLNGHWLSYTDSDHIHESTYLEASTILAALMSVALVTKNAKLLEKAVTDAVDLAYFKPEDLPMTVLRSLALSRCISGQKMLTFLTALGKGGPIGVGDLAEIVVAD